jgi:20S proteasome subunit alpha 7
MYLPSKQILAERLGLYTQAYTLYSSVRPFGISTILGAFDKDGPSLYVVEPSGVYFVSRPFLHDDKCSDLS